MMMFLTMRDGHHFGVEVDAFDISVEDVDPLEKFADWANDMCDIKIAGCDLMQHWSKQEEILAVDQRYLDVIVPRECFFQVQCCIEAAKAAAEY